MKLNEPQRAADILSAGEPRNLPARRRQRVAWFMVSTRDPAIVAAQNSFFRRALGRLVHCVIVSLLALTTSAHLLAADVAGRTSAKTDQVTPGQTRLRGRVVCIPEEKQQRAGTELPATHEHVWGFKTSDGKLYTLQRTKFSEAIFLDEEVRAKELILKVRLLPDGHAIEVSNIHSIRDGVEHDLYYYCDVCSIQSVAPEICVCCQGPVRLVEKPVTDKSETVPEK